MIRIFAALCGLALVSGLSVAMAGGPGACGATSMHGCCQPCEKVCVPVPTTKKITKVVYGYKCIDFCIPHNIECHDGCCSGGCGCCPTVCPSCEHPRVRKALIKWVRTTECPTFKCEVRAVPCGCGSFGCGQCGCGPCGCGPCGCGQCGCGEAVEEGGAVPPPPKVPVPPSAELDQKPAVPNADTAPRQTFLDVPGVPARE
jgi:hypothetical protein